MPKRTLAAVILTLVAAAILALVFFSRSHAPETPPSSSVASTPEVAPQADPPPAPTTGLTVEVHDAATGKPVGDVALTLRIDQTRLNGQTGPDGSSRFDADPTSASRIIITAKAPGWVAMQWVWQKQGAENPPTRFEILTEPAATMGGTVVDQEGKPLAGARVLVRATTKYDGHPLQNMIATPETVSDDAGKWSVGGQPRQAAISVGALHPEALEGDGFIQPAPFTDVAGLLAGTARVTLTRGTPVDIDVRGPDGNPVTGALVSYGGAQVFGTNLPAFPTNDQGTLHLAIKPGTAATLVVNASGYAPAPQHVTVASQPVKLTVKLLRSQGLTGRIVDKAGNGVAGAQVLIESFGNTNLRKTLRTDADGGFSWSDAPPDEIRAQTYARNFAGKSIRLKAGEANLIQIVPVTPFSGKVVDAESGRPLPEFKVSHAEQDADEKAAREPITWLTDYPGSSPFAKISAPGEFSAAFDTDQEFGAVRVEAPGYMPGDSPVSPLDGTPAEFVFKMVKAKNLDGTLAGADDKPAAGVTVWLIPAGRGQPLRILQGAIVKNGWPYVTTTTDANGAFSISPQKDPYKLVAVTDAGIMAVRGEVFEKNRAQHIEKWSRVEGAVLDGTHPMAGAKVRVSLIDRAQTQQGAELYSDDFATTDDNGKFVMEHLPPGELRLYTAMERVEGRGMSTSAGKTSAPIIIKPGETATVRIGGVGRPVIGRILLPDTITLQDRDQLNAVILPVIAEKPLPVMPVEVMEGTPEIHTEWWKREHPSDPAEQERRSQLNHHLNIGPGGEFRATEVVTGKYQLSANVYVASTGSRYMDRMAAGANLNFELPEMPGGVSDEPLDLGEIRLKESPPQLRADVGADLSGLVLTSLEASPVKIADYKGKYVLLNVWFTQRKDTLPERDVLAALWDTLGKSDKVAMLGLALDSRVDEPKVYTTARPMPWPQTFHGTDPTQFSAVGVCLIGPDGKVIAIGLKGDQIKTALDKAMSN